jgi:molecular chaperone GrpE (heat shock protein)
MKISQNVQVQIPKSILLLINNVFEIQKKIETTDDALNIGRNLVKLSEALEEQGLTYENPIGQEFNQTRTDLEATISGEGTENLIVVDVLKPIIRMGNSNNSVVIQKGIVIVQTFKE